MSSGTRYDSDAGHNMVNAAAAQTMGRIARLGMSPRQQFLNKLYTYYRCVQYDACRVDWDGTERSDPIDHEAIATAGFLPPGFYDAGATFPLKFRKPSAPYHLVKVIVDRFTGLLFSEQRHPTTRVQGDPKTEDFTTALTKAARLWPSMILARTYGGSMGSVATGFQFVEGRPIVEVHDPRWVFPDFIDRWDHRLRSIEKRYMYPVEERDPETGAFIPIWYWYRRVIDETRDVLFKRAPVDRGDEPDWIEEKSVEHGFGFCPVLWTQNLPVQDDIDGDPDCVGIYDTVGTIDSLVAQANRGTLANCDPTLVLTTDARLADIAKGSDNAIKLPAGSDAKYLELQGASAKAATDLADKLRAQALEVAQCVLDHPDVANQTATEIERRYSSMLAKADILREQYGEKCVKPLVEMMTKAARKIAAPAIDDGGNIIRRVLTLPASGTDANGRPTYPTLPPQETAPVELKWPHYFPPSIIDARDAAQAAGLAKSAGLIDQEHGSNFIAEYYDVEDVPGMLESIKKEQNVQQEQLQQSMTERMDKEMAPKIGSLKT